MADWTLTEVRQSWARNHQDRGSLTLSGNERILEPIPRITLEEAMSESGRYSTFRFPAMPDHWQSFLSCVILHMVLPLLPIGLEWWATSFVSVSEKSLTLAASMYSIGIGLSSRNAFMFFLTICVSILFAVAFGGVMGGQSPFPESGNFALATIVFVMFMHTLERFNRHIADREPFPEFLVRRGE